VVVVDVTGPPLSIAKCALWVLHLKNGLRHRSGNKLLERFRQMSVDHTDTVESNRSQLIMENKMEVTKEELACDFF
jgi:hypothetical protein